MKWLDFLGDYYKKQKKINGGYKYKDAMKDAAKLYKNKLPGGMGKYNSKYSRSFNQHHKGREYNTKHPQWMLPSEAAEHQSLPPYVNNSKLTEEENEERRAVIERNNAEVRAWLLANHSKTTEAIDFAKAKGKIAPLGSAKAGKLEAAESMDRLADGPSADVVDAAHKLTAFKKKDKSAKFKSKKGGSARKRYTVKKR